MIFSRLPAAAQQKSAEAFGERSLRKVVYVGALAVLLDSLRGAAFHQRTHLVAIPEEEHGKADAGHRIAQAAQHRGNAAEAQHADHGTDAVEEADDRHVGRDFVRGLCGLGGFHHHAKGAQGLAVHQDAQAHDDQQKQHNDDAAANRGIIVFCRGCGDHDGQNFRHDQAQNAHGQTDAVADLDEGKAGVFRRCADLASLRKVDEPEAHGDQDSRALPHQGRAQGRPGEQRADAVQQAGCLPRAVPAQTQDHRKIGAHRPQQAACARHGRDDVEQHHAALGSRRRQKQRRGCHLLYGVQHRVGRCVVVLLVGLLGEPGRGLCRLRCRPDRLLGRLGCRLGSRIRQGRAALCAERHRIIEHLTAFRTLFHRYFLRFCVFYCGFILARCLTSAGQSWIKRH